MRIASDKKLHLAFGVAAVIGAILVAFVSANFGLACAVLLAGVSMGIGYEAVQYFRKEGVVSHQDALFTAIPSVVFFIAYKLF